MERIAVVKVGKGYVVGIPRDVGAVYIEKVPGMWGIGEELVVKPLVRIPPPEVKVAKPPEFEEEEIPPERREEFRETLLDLLKEVHRKYGPGVKKALKKLAEVAGTTVKRLRGWLKKIGIGSVPEVHRAIEEALVEEALEEERKKEQLKEVI